MNLLPVSMAAKPTKTTIDAWARLIRAQHTALTSVERALKDAALPPLTWYDVLLELRRAGDDGLRPYELERVALLPQYGLSRLLDRIEEAGYLRKLPVTEDRRGFRTVLTPAGDDLLARMWPVYAAAIEAAVGARLSTTEAAELSRLLGKLTGPA